jgi:hypothetical protein
VDEAQTKFADRKASLGATAAARVKSEFCFAIKVIPPVQSPLAKIFRFRRRANHF